MYFVMITVKVQQMMKPPMRCRHFSQEMLLGMLTGATVIHVSEMCNLILVCIRETSGSTSEIADVTKKPEFTPFYWKFSLFVFVSEKNIAFLFSLLFVE
jgi:hypothetical protein